MEINVTHEWGILKKTLVGIASDLYFFKNEENAISNLKFASKESKKKYQAWFDIRLSKLDPEFFSKLKNQMNALTTFLRSQGIEVIEVTPLNRVESTIDSLQMFIRDPLIVIGNKIFEASMKLPYRFNERYGFRETLNIISDRKTETVIVPPGTYTSLQEIHDARGPFLEGGDVLIAGNNILVGWNDTGYASDHSGAQWLKSYLGNQYNVHLIEINDNFLHLDIGVSLLSDNLAIVCKEIFKQGIPDFFEDWDLIELSKEDVLDRLGANLLILGPKKVLIDARMDKLGDNLKERGFEVHTIEFDAVTFFAGGLRCAHHPLIREI